MKQPELGNKISQLRKAKGLTQEELVERCNISVRTIQRIETGDVNPRSYTVKTILSALESNFNELHSDSSFSENVSKTLTLSWIAGIAYFILGFVEGPMDISRIVKGSEIPEQIVSDFIPMMAFGPYFYLTVKILVLIAYVLFLRGFVSIGDFTGNTILSIVSKVLIATLVFIIGFDIISFFWKGFDGLFVQMAIAFSLGAVNIIFGFALIGLRTKIGIISIIAGAVEILSGVLLLFLEPIGLLVQMPAILLEIIIVYQISKVIAEGSDVVLKK